MSEDNNRANPKPPTVDRLSQLWRRVYDRKIAQWSVAYVALAYGIQHGVVLTREAYEWPHAVEQISMLLLTLGLPVVMTFAWYHGERASRRISGPELTIIAILLAIGSLFFYVMVRPSEQVIASNAPTVQEASVAAARSAAASPKGAVSLAVLPFVNLSSDKEQEFFSDGMTEEITAALAKVPDLRVVARTSAFEFKGKNVDIGKIGEQLHATHLIEGSVRKAGNRLRITVQLIKADDGTHVWAEDYDRDLTDIFAVQEDIARAITASLRMPLGLKPGENLVGNRNIDPDTYQKFLLAKALAHTPGRNAAEVLALLEQVVATNPNFAPAWAALPHAYFFTVIGLPGRFGDSRDEFRRGAEVYLAKGEAAARRAIQLDPSLPDGYLWLASDVMLARGNIRSADEMASKAFALDHNSPLALNVMSTVLAMAGRIKEANTIREQLGALEPLTRTDSRFNALYLWVNGQNEAALAIDKATPTNPADVVMFYASMGRYGEAADLLEKVRPDFFDAENLKEAVRLLRTAPTKIVPPQSRLQLDQLSWVYLYTGSPERALEYYEGEAKVGFRGYGLMPLVWHASYAPVRKTERFKAYVRGLGLPEYWRAKGWPPQCHPTTGDDFECN